MPLADLLDCEGAHSDPPSSGCSLLRATLFNIHVGLDRRHLDPAAVRDVFDDMLDVLGTTRARRGSPPDIDEAYRILAEVLTTAGPRLFFARTDPINNHVDCRLVTIQPSWAFGFWLDGLSHEARTGIHTAAVAHQVVQLFAQRENRLPGARIGIPGEPLWLTPSIGAVRQMIDMAFQAQYDAGYGALEGADYAQRLRDLLGLQKRTYPDRTVAMIASNTVGELQASAVSAAATAAAEGRPIRRPLAAPTQFDARDYPRFRHWPFADGQVEHDYGRTWDLADDAGDELGGAPELVSAALDPDQIGRVISLGLVTSPSTPEDEVAERTPGSRKRSAAMRTLESLVAALTRRLAT